MREYWKQPELTRQTFCAHGLKTGDIGYLDPDGYLFLLGRGSEMINVGGRKVAPDEVEVLLCQMEGVTDAGCVAGARRVAGRVRQGVPGCQPGDWAGRGGGVSAAAAGRIQNPQNGRQNPQYSENEFRKDSAADAAEHHGGRVDLRAMNLRRLKRLLWPPEVCVGRNCVERLGCLDPARVLVVTGHSARSDGTLDRVTGQLKDATAHEVVEWAGGEPRAASIAALREQWQSLRRTGLLPWAAVRCWTRQNFCGCSWSIRIWF